MTNVENVRESAAAIKQHLIGDGEKSGARQVLAAAKTENGGILGLHEELKVKLEEAAAIAARIIFSAEGTTSSLREGQAHTAAAQAIAEHVFDTPGAASLRQSLGATAAVTELVANMSDLAAQQLKAALDPVFKINSDVRTMTPPGLSDIPLDRPAIAVTEAHAAMTDYEQQL